MRTCKRRAMPTEVSAQVGSVVQVEEHWIPRKIAQVKHGWKRKAHIFGLMRTLSMC